MKWNRAKKKTKPNRIYAKISLHILTIIYLLFLIVHQIHSPTTAYFTDISTVNHSIEAEPVFMEEVEIPEEEKEDELDQESDKESKNAESELDDEQNEQQENNKDKSLGTEVDDQENETVENKTKADEREIVRKDENPEKDDDEDEETEKEESIEDE